MSGALEIAGAGEALLDEPLDLRVRGAGPDAALTWRARLRDDDGRVWRASAERPEALAAAWGPAKAGTGAVAALRSLRPVSVDVRVEAGDGRGASRTVTRRLLADGVRRRRWRGEVAGVLHLPAGGACARVVVAGGDDVTVELAAALLASRGVLVVTVRERDADAAHALLAQVPGTTVPGTTVPGDDLVLPPGVPARSEAGDPAERAAAWDALLARFGARPRGG